MSGGEGAAVKKSNLFVRNFSLSIKHVIRVEEGVQETRAFVYNIITKKNKHKIYGSRSVIGKGEMRRVKK